MTLMVEYFSLAPAWAIVGTLIVIGCVALSCQKNLRRFLHIMQLESYQVDGYLRCIKRNRTTDLLPLFGIALFGVALEAVSAAIGQHVAALWRVLMAAAALAITMALAIEYAKRRNAQKQKTEFVMTQRMQRLARACSILSALCCALGVVLGMLAFAALQEVSVLLGAVCAGLLGYAPLALLGYVVALGTRLRQRPENKINQGFIDDAKRILQNRPDLYKVGITGSFGKTSAKFILGTILREKYNVLVPPASYNTPMGVTRMVREMLTDEHEVMIAEMGARHVGEIKELCEIVHPRYGLITSVGKQHLETFGSLENIIHTKFELMEALPPDGVGAFPDDKGICTALYEGFDGNKRLFGMQDEGVFMAAKDVSVGPMGSTFTLCCQGEEAACRTRLLGRHNIMNILGCATIAYEMGLTLREIATGIGKVEPVEHRLQLIDPQTGVLIIDDAFNSNPTGTQMAMDVLAMFEGYRHICVTPGLVELGEIEEEENRKFGQRMAAVCDIVILVGEKRALAMQEGLLSEGFVQQNIYIVKNLDEATQLLGTLTRPQDVVLLENDLPDHYVQ